MTMTVEEKRKRRSDLQWQKHSAAYESRKSAMVSLFKRAAAEHMTHDDMLNYRRDWIYYNNYSQLPRWLHERLTGVWDALQAVHWGILTFCYDHPLTGVPTPANILCNEGLASKLDSSTGHHYYKNADGTYSNPFN